MSESYRIRPTDTLRNMVIASLIQMDMYWQITHVVSGNGSAIITVKHVHSSEVFTVHIS